MESETVKESRRLLRRVQDHIIQSHMALGAVQESIGLVDVIYHPVNHLADLNYVTPRRNTAWVSGNFIQQGIERLRELDRLPRVQYIEGLFPPLFARTLRDLGLAGEHETPIMIYKTDGINGVLPPPAVVPSPPDGVHLQTVTDQRGIELWWYVWRNAFFDVLTLGVEPLVVGRDMAALHQGRQVDILLYRYSFPVGVVRIGLNAEGQTAHVIALALMREERTPEMTRLLLAASLEAAVKRGCTMVFAPGEGEDDRRICRDLGFMDFGSMMCYSDGAKHDAPNGRKPLAPVLRLMWDKT